MKDNLALFIGAITSLLGHASPEQWVTFMSSCAGVVCALIALVRAVCYFILYVRTKDKKHLEQWLKESKQGGEDDDGQ